MGLEIIATQTKTTAEVETEAITSLELPTAEYYIGAEADAIEEWISD